ncbi:MAG: leucine-rich repeat domain-containing protein [Aureispira sp.]|nr:leucine-rich repeat domain-containing protein [Aureispira sp.]
MYSVSAEGQYLEVKNNILRSMHEARFVVSYKSSLRQLPPEIGQMENLKELYIYGCHSLKDLPEELGQLKNLKKLNLAGSFFQKLPKVLAKLEGLEELNLSKMAFTKTTDWTPIAKLPNLKNLILVGTLARIKTLPKELLQLPKLESLDIRYNYMRALPANLGELKCLKSIRCGGNSFLKFPAVLTTLPNLKELSISARLLNELSPNLLRLAKLDNLEVTGKHSQKYKKVYFLEKLLKGIKRHYFSEDYQSLILDLLREKRTIGELENKDLLVVLNSGIDKLCNETLLEIESRIIAGTLSDKKPLKKALKVTFRGKFGGKVSQLKARLKELNIKTGTKIDKNSTHVMLGKNAGEVYDEIITAGATILTEKMLVEQLNMLDKPYLLTTTTDSTDNIEHVRSLLMSGAEENILLGFEILHGGGFPKDLITELFLLYKGQYSKKIRREILRFVEQYAPAQFATAIKRRLSINGQWVSEDTIRRNLEYYCKVGELDTLKVAQYLYKSYKKGAHFALFNLSTAEKQQYLKNLMEANGVLNLSRLQLDDLPDDLHLIKGVRVLNLSSNKFPKLPASVLKMNKLEELHLRWMMYMYQFPKELLQMPNLNKIYLSRRFNNMPTKKELEEAGCEVILNNN